MLASSLGGPQFATLANIATIVGTGIAVWGFVSRILTRARRRNMFTALTRGEAQIVAVLAGGLGASVAVIILLALQNRALINEHNGDLSSFNHAALVVEGYAKRLEYILGQILKKVSGQ